MALGFLFGVGALAAYWLGGLLLSVGGVILLVVVAMFLAVGLDPVVNWLVRHRFRRPWAVVVVISGVLLALVMFFVALVPVISEQVGRIIDQAPGWFAQLQQSRARPGPRRPLRGGAEGRGLRHQRRLGLRACSAAWSG